MSKLRIIALVVTMIVVGALIIACSGGGTNGEVVESTSGENHVVDQSEPTSVVEEQQQAVEGGEEQAPAEENVEQAKIQGEVPEDLPIMDGAYELQVTPDGSNVSYQVDTDIDAVMAFYTEELPNFGWEQTRTPDTALGSMATMSRENAAKDRLTFSIQYNPVGKFSVLRIVILRAPK